MKLNINGRERPEVISFDCAIQDCTNYRGAKLAESRKHCSFPMGRIGRLALKSCDKSRMQEQETWKWVKKNVPL